MPIFPTADTIGNFRFAIEIYTFGKRVKAQCTRVKLSKKQIIYDYILDYEIMLNAIGYYEISTKLKKQVQIVETR
eukprot:snap_masked-scaffold_51-processed-gene-0.14-mRNA-1 protein AED:1.00 eAED:1.00 QI:0/0/0/0/1/1/3/0/74